jgi:hypothetical protein
MGDIEAGLNVVGLRNAAAYETGFPTVATLIDEVRMASQRRSSTGTRFKRCEECKCECLEDSGYARREDASGKVWMEHVECWKAWKLGRIQS